MFVIEVSEEIKGANAGIDSVSLPLATSSLLAGENEVVYLKGKQGPVEIDGAVQDVLLLGAISYQGISGVLARYIGSYGSIKHQTILGNIASELDWLGAVSYIDLFGRTDESQFVDMENYPWLDFSNERNSMYLGVL